MSLQEAFNLINVSHVLWMYVPPFLIFPGAIGNICCIITLQVGIGFVIVKLSLSYVFASSWKHYTQED